jgi:hypothetical protein
VFDDVIPLPQARFRMHSEDPTFQVAWRGGGRFALDGQVSEDPTTELGVDTPSGSVEVPLAKNSLPEHAVRMLKRAMPRDVYVSSRPSGTGVEVTLTEAVIPAARPPRLRVLSTDMDQRVKQLEENKVEFVGAAGGACLLTIMCDARRVTIQVPGKTSAATTAIRVAAGIPTGYRALVDGSTVSVWKDAEFFEAVA